MEDVLAAMQSQWLSVVNVSIFMQAQPMLGEMPLRGCLGIATYVLYSWLCQIILLDAK